MPAAVPRPRFAVFVRTHVQDEKTFDLLRTLGAGHGFDLFVATDETSKTYDFGPYRTAPFSLTDFEGIGLQSVPHSANYGFPDIPMARIAERLPQYDYYLFTEYDVHLIGDSPDYFEQIMAAVIERGGDGVDLAGARLREPDDTWSFYRSAHKRFERVHAVFFPLLIFAKRALAALLELRAEEARSLTGDEQPLFCEAFAPSALMKRGGFNLLDLNDLVPGGYDREVFSFDEYRFLEQVRTSPPEGAIAHPVYTARNFVERELARARENGLVDDFARKLRHGWPELPPTLRAEFLSREPA